MNLCLILIIYTIIEIDSFIRKYLYNIVILFINDNLILFLYIFYIWMIYIIIKIIDIKLINDLFRIITIINNRFYKYNSYFIILFYIILI